MTGKHTSGPWTVNARYISEVDAPNGLTVASCWHANTDGQTIIVTDVNPVSLEESAANARLISKAPELLDALRDVLEDAHEEAYPEARALIAEIEGN